MTDTVAQLAHRGRLLSLREHVRLLDLLHESLHESSTSTVEEAWNAETERRVALYERGEAVLQVAEEVMAEAARIAPFRRIRPMAEARAQLLHKTRRETLGKNFANR